MRYQRRDVKDVVSRDGETAVLVRGRLVRLSGVSAFLWELTRERVTAEDLATAMEARFGPPAEKSTLDATKDALTQLMRLGVLRRSA